MKQRINDRLIVSYLNSDGIFILLFFLFRNRLHFQLLHIRVGSTNSSVGLFLPFQTLSLSSCVLLDNGIMIFLCDRKSEPSGEKQAEIGQC